MLSRCRCRDCLGRRSAVDRIPGPGIARACRDDRAVGFCSVPKRRRGVSFWQGGTDRDARFIPKPPRRAKPPKPPGPLDTWPPAYRDMIARWLIKTRLERLDLKWAELVPLTERRIGEAGRPAGVPARLNGAHTRALFALRAQLDAADRLVRKEATPELDPLVRRSDTANTDGLYREPERRRLGGDGVAPRNVKSKKPTLTAQQVGPPERAKPSRTPAASPKSASPLGPVGIRLEARQWRHGLEVTGSPAPGGHRVRVDILDAHGERVARHRAQHTPNMIRIGKLADVVRPLTIRLRSTAQDGTTVGEAEIVLP
jgi:hypothetical protein